jgi:hypothetical protein
MQVTKIAVSAWDSAAFSLIFRTQEYFMDDEERLRNGGVIIFMRAIV